MFEEKNKVFFWLNGISMILCWYFMLDQLTLHLFHYYEIKHDRYYFMSIRQQNLHPEGH